MNFFIRAALAAVFGLAPHVAIAQTAAPAPKEIWTYSDSSVGAFGWRDQRPDGDGVIRSRRFDYRPNAPFQEAGFTFHWLVEDFKLDCRARTYQVIAIRAMNLEMKDVANSAAAGPVTPIASGSFKEYLANIMCDGVVLSTRREAWSEIDAMEMAQRLVARR